MSSCVRFHLRGEKLKSEHYFKKVDWKTKTKKQQKQVLKLRKSPKKGYIKSMRNPKKHEEPKQTNFQKRRGRQA